MSATTPIPAPAGPQPTNNTTGTHTSGSLYVGDLAPDVTEALLFEMFNHVGPVSSIRVCRDAATRLSLGYAYVNFHSVTDAERALDTLNFAQIKGHPCRIMWSQRDPSARKNATCNIFIKNLDKSVDNKSLFDTFSTYGNILSCKVATDSTMQSRGFAFVHFEKEEEAQKAIDEVNGKLINGKKVFVGKFERRSQRSDGGTKFTNVYVKYIPAEWDEPKLRDAFEPFGSITSLYLPTDAEGKHKGFGFINYETFEQAQRAKEDGSKIAVGEDKTLFVDRFQKKAEREAVLAKKHEEIRRQKSERYKNLNLYVKNLDDDVDDAKLKEMFTPFGEITSSVVMRDDQGGSKGFGFVCFENADDATRALGDMNGKMVGAKPIYVNRAQRKEERRAQLEGQFMQGGLAGQRMPPMTSVFFAGPGGNPVMGPGISMFPHTMGVPRGRFPNQQPMHPGGRPPYGPGTFAGAPQTRGGRMMPGRGNAVPNQRGMPKQRYGGGSRRDMPVPVAIPSVPAPVSQQTYGSDLEHLAQLSPEEQKQILGEKLFIQIQKMQPELAPKITGMLLEMEVADVLAIIDSQSELKAKVDEAMEVLNATNPSS